jgi:hypothetical protein
VLHRPIETTPFIRIWRTLISRFAPFGKTERDSVTARHDLDHKPMSYRPRTLAELRHLTVSLQPVQVQKYSWVTK